MNEKIETNEEQKDQGLKNLTRNIMFVIVVFCLGASNFYTSSKEYSFIGMFFSIIGPAMILFVHFVHPLNNLIDSHGAQDDLKELRDEAIKRGYGKWVAKDENETEFVWSEE